MQLAIEIALRPNLHVRSHPGSTESSVSRTPPPEMLWGYIGENDHDVVIAIWTRIAARRRTEQVDAQRVIDLYQSPHHLGQHRVVSRRRSEALNLGFRHAYQSQFATGIGQKVGLVYFIPPSRG